MALIVTLNVAGDALTATALLHLQQCCWLDVAGTVGHSAWVIDMQGWRGSAGLVLVGQRRLVVSPV